MGADSQLSYKRRISKMEPNLILPWKVREALLKYLYSRPMGEVEPGVIALRNLKQLPLEDYGEITEEELKAQLEK